MAVYTVPSYVSSAWINDNNLWLILDTLKIVNQKLLYLGNGAIQYSTIGQTFEFLAPNKIAEFVSVICK